MNQDTPRILVIEDDAEWIQSYRNWMERQGYSVTAARTRDEALKALAEPDWWVILIDRKLQGPDRPDEGTNLLVEAGRLAPGAKTFMVTAYIEGPAVERAFALGAYDYVEKTEHIESILTAKVRNAVEAVRDRRQVGRNIETAITDSWQHLQDPTLTPQARGQALEALVVALFRSMPGFEHARTNVRNPSQEIDVVVRNKATDPFWQRQGDYLLVECKHWSAPVDPKELAHIKDKAQRYGRCRLAFFVAWSGFTAGLRDQLIKGAGGDLLIVTLDRGDLEGLVQSTDRMQMLERLHERATLEERG